MILLRPIRKILSILRGGVSPVLIFLSIILGFCFGLMPGWSGLHVVLIILALVLNIHIGLFLISAAVGKSLCFAAAPLLYYIGVGVHDYVPGFLGLLASIPIVGITDFSKYSIAGALVLGPVIGAVAGLLLARSVIGFRRMMLKLEEGSEKFQKWYSNRWVRIMDRVLVGKRTKDAKALFSAKTKIFRKAGVVLALLVVAISAMLAADAKDRAMKEYAAERLTQANGAEVNLEELDVSVLTGAVSASGIQVTDAENPQNNQVAVQRISADSSIYNLLIGKVVMDKVQVSEVRFDQKRSTPGKVFKPDTDKKPPIFDPCDLELDPTKIGKLEEYIKDAKALKERLKKLRKWLPKEKDEKKAREVPEKYLEYLQARADVPASPRIMAKRILLEKVEIPYELFGNSNILLQNISDCPQAAGLPVIVEVKSAETGAALNIKIEYSSPDAVPKVTGTFEGLDLSKLQSSLGSGAGLAFASGVASGEFDGQLTSQFVDLTAKVTLRDLEAKGLGKGILGLGSETTSEAFNALEELKTTVRIIGPTTEPRLVFDTEGLTEQFKTALVEAGKERLAEELDKQVQKHLGDKLGDKVPGQLKDVLKKPKDLLDGIGGLLRKKDDKEPE